MRARTALFAFAVAALGASGARAADNLVVNGDFSAGNAGFSSGYTYAAPSYSALYPEGLYTVAGDPNAVHQYWVPLDPSNARLIVNGATQPDPKTGNLPTIWEEDNLGTVAGQTYDFEASAANICCNSSFGDGENDPSHLLFESSTNDFSTYTTLAELMTHPPGDAGMFDSVSAQFVASGATSFRIVNVVSGQSGNDFAIDNIRVTAAAPEPATWALMLGGIGILGGMMRVAHARRREEAAIGTFAA